MKVDYLCLGAYFLYLLCILSGRFGAKEGGSLILRHTFHTNEKGLVDSGCDRNGQMEVPTSPKISQYIPIPIGSMRLVVCLPTFPIKNQPFNHRQIYHKSHGSIMGYIWWAAASQKFDEFSLVNRLNGSEIRRSPVDMENITFFYLGFIHQVVIDGFLKHQQEHYIRQFNSGGTNYPPIFLIWIFLPATTRSSGDVFSIF